MQIQSTLIPGGFLGSDKPQLLALGAKNTSILGISLNQPLYQPGINSSIKIAENKQALEAEKNEQSKINVKTQIATAYLNVLLKRLQRQIASNEEDRYREYMELAQGKFKNGALIENDFLRAKLNYENAKVQLQTASQDYDLSLDKLKNEINIPGETQLILVDSLNDQHNISQNTSDAFSQADTRTEIKQLKIEQTGNQLSLTKMRHNDLPTVSFVANYAEQFLYNDFNYLKG